MTQVQLERHPFVKYTYYKGMYTHNSIGYAFELTVVEKINNIQPDLSVEFEVGERFIPFDYDKASKEILAIYLPDADQKTKD